MAKSITLGGIWLATLVLAFAAGLQLASPRSPRPQAVQAIATSDAAMEEGLSSALGEPDPLLSAARIVALLQQLGPDNVSGALRAFEADRADEAQLRLFGAAWGRLDGPSAFERLARWSQGKRSQALPAAVYAWALTDPHAARDAVATLEDRSLEQACIEQLVNGWKLSGADGLDAFFAQLPRTVLRQRSVNRWIWEWLRRDSPEAVMRWVESLPDDAFDDFKQTAFVNAAGLIAKQQPLLAARWVDAHADQPYTRGAERRVAGPWLRVDADAALVWLEKMPAGVDRDRTVEWCVRQWLVEDREAAEAWLRAVELRPLLWPAVRLYARRLVKEAPDQSLAWCERIGDADEALTCRIDVGQSWFREDPAAARAWVAHSDLPEDARREILAQRPRPGAARTPARGADDAP